MSKKLGSLLKTSALDHLDHRINSLVGEFRYFEKEQEEEVIDFMREESHIFLSSDLTFSIQFELGEEDIFTLNILEHIENELEEQYEKEHWNERIDERLEQLKELIRKVENLKRGSK